MLTSGPAIAASPVAIVEEIEAAKAKVTFMSYLEQGKKIELGPRGRIVIGYLKSCLREEITGGQVLVGAERSKVTDGTVKRTRVECDGGKLILTPEEAGKGAVIVFRKPPPPPAGGPVSAAHKVFSLQPFFRLNQAARVVSIRRLDLPEKSISLPVTNGTADMATKGGMLHRGGIYSASAGSRKIIFKIDSRAKSGGSILSRLVIL